MSGAKAWKCSRKQQRDGPMIHPSLIAIAAIVVVFGILNFIEYKRLD